MLNDHAATSTTMWHETPQLILICEFPKFTALPEKVAIINLLPANVWNLLTDLGFDANLMSESDLDAVLDSVKNLVTPQLNL